MEILLLRKTFGSAPGAGNHLDSWNNAIFGLSLTEFVFSMPVPQKVLMMYLIYHKNYNCINKKKIACMM